VTVLAFDGAVGAFRASLGPMSGALGSVVDPDHLTRARAYYLGSDLVAFCKGVFRAT